MISTLNVKIVNNSTNELPTYAHPTDAGMDLRANIINLNQSCLKESADYVFIEGEPAVCLRPGGRVLIPTGLHIQLPEGYEAQIRPRSGLAAKHGITVVNSPGTIDAGFTGDVGVILLNTGSEPFIIKQGDRIAQMVIAKYETAIFELVETLDQTDRGEGGFGHTGKE